jgi:trk system potassium uptake protein TrkH
MGMRDQVVWYLLGTFLIFLGACLTVPLVAALGWGEPTTSALALAVVLCLGGGVLLRRLVVGSPTELTQRQGLMVVTAVWVMASLLGALPFWISGGIPNGVDAWFETTSGLTTTGASILTDIEALPKSLLLWRSLTHWLGGLGIVVMVIAVLPSLGAGGAFLYRGETGLAPERLTPRLSNTAKILAAIYSGLTAAEIGLLLLGGMSLFDAVTHAFGTIATGGFSPRNASVGAYQSFPIELIIMVFMFLGGCNFGLYYRVLTGRWREAWRNTEWRVFVILLVASIGLITANIISAEVYTSLPRALRAAAFQVVSIGTTTGFVTADFDTWPQLSRTLLLLLMFSGACLGSTSGAIKLGRLILLVKLISRTLRRILHPKQVQVVLLDGNVVGNDVLQSTAAFFFLYLGIAAVASLLLTGFGLDTLTSLSAVATTIGGVGPGLNVVGPARNFASLPIPGKLILIACMFLGRLELYTVLVLGLPDFWRM